MDPQSVSFQPQGDLWRFQGELQRVQAIQAEHNDRLTRIERKHDDDARMKSVWGGASPFPGVLSGTPQQTPLHQPASDAFKSFDDESANLIGSLHLDADEEPRRIGATSRANSVRFDESANYGHWSHASRSSMDMIRSAGGVPMSERTPSHKSEGRASSVHSMRSAASGRASSINIDTGYSFDDPTRSPIEDLGLAPGLLVLGAVPAIVRCWLNTNFKHNALMYAGVCTGSYKSLIDRRLVDQLGFSDRITETVTGPSITLQVHLPEAVPHPASVRSGSPQPQVPTVTVHFNVFSPPVDSSEDSRGIQIIIGSDTLRLHNADILFSSNKMCLFDDERNKLSVPLVRPEDDRTFKGLSTTSASLPFSSSLTASSSRQGLDGLGQQTQPSIESDSSTAGGVIGTRKSTIPTHSASAAHADTPDSSDEEKVPRTGRTIRFASLAQSLPAPEHEGAIASDDSDRRPASSHTSATSPAIWSNWRQRGPEQTQAPTLDYASASKQRETAPRKESGMKVLRPLKPGSRSFSTASSSPGGFNGDGRSRFFDEGRKRGTTESQVIESKMPIADPSAQESGDKARVNPAGGGSAFSWLKSTGPR